MRRMMNGPADAVHIVGVHYPTLVRAVGIEPTLLSEPDFESGASTSSTTPASRRIRFAPACGGDSANATGPPGASRGGGQRSWLSLLPRRL